MSKRILIDASFPEEKRVVLLENHKVIDYDYELKHKPQIKGNIYLAKVTRVEPSLQAAFIDYGGGKHGFLPFAEIHPNYFNIPVNERDKSNKSIFDNLGEISPPDLNNIDHEEEVISHSAHHSHHEDRIEEVRDVTIVNDEVVPFEIAEDSARNSYKKYKIQEVFKKNQIILVQAIKEERGNKGASFTSYISLAGRYCVLMPNIDKQGGISRKVVDASKRNRLKAIVDSLKVPEGVSVIIRTAGEDKLGAEIRRDYDYLVRLWNSVREHTIVSKAPTFIHAEGDLFKRTIRDTFDNQVKEIFVQGADAYHSIREFANKIFPGNDHKIKHYKNSLPLFHKFNVDDQIKSLYSTVANLESGGYLVINATEALTSIDVNSGKSTSERNIEETAVKTNIEAAKEVARQIKLRDISGLIVIDFIDMNEYNNKRHVEKVLRDAVKNDRARVQMSSITPFGLVEISRQRLRSSFAETNMVQCEHCSGRGSIRDPESNALLIIRTIESELSCNILSGVTLFAHSLVILYIMNNKRKHIDTLEEKYKVKIHFEIEDIANLDSYSLDLIPKENNKSISKKNLPTMHEEEIEIGDLDSYQNENDLDEIKNDSSNSDENQMFKINKMSHNKKNNNRRVKPSNNRRKKKKYEDEVSPKNQSEKEGSWWKKLFG
jgi:ribonuclease E